MAAIMVEVTSTVEVVSTVAEEGKYKAWCECARLFLCKSVDISL